MIIDPGTLSVRCKLTIGCTPDGGSVCSRQFTRMPDEDPAEPDGPGRPFRGGESPDLLSEVPHGGWTTRTLRDVEVTWSFEYVVLGADRTPLMDPVIIIGPN